MIEKRSCFNLYCKSPLRQLLITIPSIIILGGALFIVLFVIGLLVSGIEFSSVYDDFLVNQGEERINFLRYLLIAQDISFFIVPAIILRRYLLFENKSSYEDFFRPDLKEIIFVILLSFCLFPITGITGELNSSMKLPEWLSGAENWMRMKETEAAGFVDLLMPSEGVGLMVFNLFLIALLPAFSEELIFRGVFQKIFYGVFRSSNTAVWFTALLFSAMHFQFYGFIPRLILGLSFGYLYFWGRTIWLPILAHFVNNCVPVVAAYLYGWDKVNTVPETPFGEQMTILAVSVCVSVIILSFFRKKYKLALKIGTKNLPD